MKSRKSYLSFAVMMLPLVLALLCLWIFTNGSHQSSYPVPMPQSFIGEYSYDGENWFELTEDADLSTRHGNLKLRGHFERDTADGQNISYYRNHIGVDVFINGERVYIDAVTETAGMGKKLFTSMCGQEWASFGTKAISSEDEIEIHLYNPHRFGNESAYRDFLSTLCSDIEGVNLLPKALAPYGTPFRIIGSLFAIASLMILGVALASVLTHIDVGGKLLKQSMLTLCMGCFIILDTIDVSFWNELVVLNTYGKQLSFMLACSFAGYFFSDSLHGRKRFVAKLALTLSSVFNAGLIIASLAGLTAIFESLPLWLGSQLIVCLLLMVCCAMELYKAPKTAWLIPLSCILFYTAVLLDIFAVGGTFVLRNPWSKLAFILLFIVHLMNAARGIVINHHANIRAAKLEKELEDKRISIMLSQIQPHFLYNVLGTIRGLCRENPMQARQALGDFSDYLRGNMSALSNSNTIHFTGELRHVETYLRLEKMRMGEKLNILYDVQEKNFFIPPLTIQPLVENAVKHGLFEKGGGTLILHTRREEDNIIISVTDDGVGFDQSAPLLPDRHHAHVGLSNVRSRLEKMSGGQLIIDSTPGSGTTATVLLHYDSGENGGNEANEYSGH